MDHVRAWLETADVNIPEPTDDVPPWESPAWLAEADAWISASREAAGLTVADALTRWSPGDAPPVIAVDRERHWVLTRDAGERLDGLHSDLRAELREWAKELAGLGFPSTIDHEDLHPGNILGTSGF